MANSIWIIAISLAIWFGLGLIVYNHQHPSDVIKPSGTAGKQNVDIILPKEIALKQSISSSTGINHSIKLSPVVFQTPIVSQITENINPSSADYVKKADAFRSIPPLPWNNFVDIKVSPHKLRPQRPFISDTNNLSLHVCSEHIVQQLYQPQLSQQDFKWCQWALSSSGGQVKIGTSYGKLSGSDRLKYEQLNCNKVADGTNPSCDDSWGDGQLLSWKKNVLSDMCGDSSLYSSKVQCSDSSSLARFCLFENVLFDFSKMKRRKRGGRSDSRSWDEGFLSTHCNTEKGAKTINFYEFYKPAVHPETTTCDYVINETVLVYSHDDINNLGHTMSDMMNVWAMLWLAGQGSVARTDVTFLNIDAFRMGHLFEDQFSQFFRPLLLFTWDGWWVDMPCSFLGPSSLFQRWNLQIRNSYGLLAPQSMPTNDRIQVLLVVRRLGTNIAGMYKSRVFTNEKDIESHLRDVAFRDTNINLVVQDLATLTFKDQVALLSSSSVVIGVHGAGIPHTMHMAIGSRYCCGVIEIFPEGEFKPIRGYGNMARRMGHVYSRIDLSGSQSTGNGCNVPPATLAKVVLNVIADIKGEKRSCVLPSVLSDPFFDSAKSMWSPI